MTPVLTHITSPQLLLATIWVILMYCPQHLAIR
jgi:hypothetical protein